MEPFVAKAAVGLAFKAAFYTIAWLHVTYAPPCERSKDPAGWTIEICKPEEKNVHPPTEAAPAEPGNRQR